MAYEFYSAMMEREFVIYENDKYVYMKELKNGYVILYIYVNGMTIIGSNDKMIKSTKDTLRSIFDLKDFGPVDAILGIKILYIHPMG